MRDAAKDLEQRALTSAVAANNADDLALFNLKAYVFKRPELFDFVTLNNLPPAK